MSKTITEEPSKAKYTIYKCGECDKTFKHFPGKEKKCIRCGNDDEITLEPLEQVFSDTVEGLYTEDDFQGG